MNLYAALHKPASLIDTHAHLNDKKFEVDRAAVIQKAVSSGVEMIYDTAVDFFSIDESLAISKENPNVRSFIGIDPEIFIPGSVLFKGFTDNEDWFGQIYGRLDQTTGLNIGLLAGIGETGMDYYWIWKLKKEHKIPEEDYEKSKILQEKLFKIHLLIASTYGLPVTVHSRGAEKECLEIVKGYPNTTGIFHSYTGSYDVAKKVLDIGWGLGVNGIITFANGKELREIYKKILGKVSSSTRPEDFYQKGIYFETDAPYLAPEGKRGQRNDPSNVKDIYESFVQFIKA